MNTLALVQMAREFAECGREAEAQRVMDEACEELAEPVRETASASGRNWGGHSYTNIIKREMMRSALKESEARQWRERSPFWGIDRSVYPERLSGVRFAEPGAGSADFTVSRDQLYRTVRYDVPGKTRYLQRQVDAMVDGLYERCGISRVSHAEYNAAGAHVATFEQQQARLDYLNQRMKSLLDAPKLWYRPGKVGGALSRELWRSAQ